MLPELKLLDDALDATNTSWNFKIRILSVKCYLKTSVLGFPRRVMSNSLESPECNQDFSLVNASV